MNPWFFVLCITSGGLTGAVVAYFMIRSYERKKSR